MRVFISLLLTGIVVSCSDSIENYYGDYQSMKESDSYVKGWIPVILPESATNIYEKHDLDLNKVWMRFNCDSTDLPQLVSHLIPADSLKNVVSTLENNFNLPPKSSYFTFNEREFFAINYKQKLVFYYRSNY